MTAIVTSDVHFGSRFCRGEAFLRFLHALPPEAALVLNGDVVNYRPRFSDTQRRALDALRRESQRRPVVWVRGNHDARYRMDDPGRIVFQDACTIGGRLYVAHGHHFERLTSHCGILLALFRTLYRLGCLLHAETVHVAHYARRFRALYRMLQDQVARHAAELARRHGLRNVVCGHTHTAEQRVENGIRYFNTGAWTEEDQACCLVVNERDMRLIPAAELETMPMQTVAPGGEVLSEAL